MSTIRAKIRLLQSLSGLDLVVIDNLQLIRPMDYRLPKHQQLKQLTEAFKKMAKDLDVAIVMLCQLAVDAEPTKDGKNKEPDNTSWADSKRIVDDADVAYLTPSG
jgi:replicative DNA helicase